MKSFSLAINAHGEECNGCQTTIKYDERAYYCEENDALYCSPCSQGVIAIEFEAGNEITIFD